MNFKEYQEKAVGTSIYPDSVKVIYPAMGLGNEAGEVLGKIKKALRGDYELADKKEDICKELGDVLWYIAALAKDLGIELEDVASANLEKLQSRKEKGTLKGDGDKR